MSLGLTKPGLSATLRHPKTGVAIVPLGYTKTGRPIMPVLGASSDDEDDPNFTDDSTDPPSSRHRDDQDDNSDDNDDDDNEDDKPPAKKTKKDEDDLSRPERQAARYRTKLRAAEQKNAELEARLRKIEDSDKPVDELMKRDLAEATERVENLTETNRILTAQLAFFKSSDVDWVDASDAFSLAERAGLFDDVIDEDGNVDTRELRRGLRDLAKRKPYLVKKARGRNDEDDKDNDEPGSRSSASTMNKRKGKQNTGTDRAALAKRFPVLGR